MSKPALIMVWKGVRRHGDNYCHDYYPCLMKIGKKYIKRLEYMGSYNKDGFWKTMFNPSPTKECVLFTEDEMIPIEKAYNFIVRYGGADDLATIFGEDL